MVISNYKAQFFKLLNVFVNRLHISVIGRGRKRNFLIAVYVECVKMVASAELTAAHDIVADIRFEGINGNEIVRTEIAVVKIIIVV